MQTGGGAAQIGSLQLGPATELQPGATTTTQTGGLQLEAVQARRLQLSGTGAHQPEGLPLGASQAGGLQLEVEPRRVVVHS